LFEITEESKSKIIKIKLRRGFKMAEAKYANYIVTDLKEQEFKPGFAEEYAKFATRILWMDNRLVEGSIHFSCSWYFKPPENHLGMHSHDYTLMVGYIGSNPTDPSDLGGEIEFWLEDEKYIITKSCLIFLPKGIKHGGDIRRVDRPIFHMGIHQ
jgi:hypothetical protein